MKAIQEIEALMLDHLTKGDPEAYWKPETINFPGVSIAFEHGGDSNYPFIFQIFLTFSGISLHTHYHLGTGVTLCEEVKSLCVTLCEKIEERGAKRVREEFKGVRSI